MNDRIRAALPPMALFLLLTLLPSLAFADADCKADMKIEELEAVAKAAYDKGDYDTAIDCLLRVNLKSPHPNYMINIAFTYSEKGDCKNARTFAQSAIDSQDIDPGARDAAQQIISTCVEKVDDKDNGTPGLTPDRDMTLTWIGAGVGGAGVVASVITLVLDLGLKDDKQAFLDLNEQGGFADSDAFETEKKKLQNRESTVTIGYGVSGLLIAGGLTLIVVDLMADDEVTPAEPTEGGSPAEGSLRLSPLLAPSAAGLMFSGDF